MIQRSCDLCGLPAPGDTDAQADRPQSLQFCCLGCRMVYRMLTDAAGTADPARFKETDLYRRCVAAGVLPADETDLAARLLKPAPTRLSDTPSQNRSQTLFLQAKVNGMWCPACAWVIQTALERIQGVFEAVCDFTTDRLRCCYDPALTSPRAILDAIQSLGYATYTDASEENSRLRQKAFVRWSVTTLLAVNVMMLSWALYSGFFTSLSQADIRFISWPILVMTTVVMVYGGGPLFRKAWWGMRHGAPGMEALVCLGAGSAYAYSCINFALGSWHVYFDTAAMLIALVLLGKLLESGAKADVRRDLEAFLALQPTKVRRIAAEFPQGRFVSLDQLKPGDYFQVDAGEMVPADGRVVRGKGVVDASVVTGESRPLTLSEGDFVSSGTTLTHGQVAVEALRVGAEALLGQMVAVIENGLMRRTPLESRTDRWLALFVPLMVLLSVATGAVVWVVGESLEQAFVRALTVMVIACPCALGIAVPLARTAGLSKAARKGILVRESEAFERATRIEDIVFDKTGTLTQGCWLLESCKSGGPWSKDQVLALAAGLEKNVDHTIARVIRTHVRDQGLEAASLTDIRVEPGGVRGNFQGELWRIGSRDYALGQGDNQDSGDDFEELRTTVYLSRDGALAAVFHFGDSLREGSPALIRQLEKAGYTLHLVSGDSDHTTRRVARHLGLANAQGGLMPQAKSTLIETLQARGRRVAMVGDGINDAPALARADLSVAVHRDASLARQAAAVTLMRGDPAQLLDFFALAQQVNATVSRNLAWAWVYNLVGVPIAMSGLLNPLISVTAMLLSSLTVIGNTLLLVRRK